MLIDVAVVTYEISTVFFIESEDAK